jgi:hypothetical protein
MSRKVNNEMHRTVITADKCITVFALQLTIHVLLGLFHGDVHVSVQARKNS